MQKIDMPTTNSASKDTPPANKSSLDVTMRSSVFTEKLNECMVDCLDVSNKNRRSIKIGSLQSLDDTSLPELKSCISPEHQSRSAYWDSAYEYRIRRKSSHDALSSSYSRIERKPIKSSMSVRSLNESLHSSFSSSSKKFSNVSFQSVEIREYSPTLGDNPSVSQGPPMTLGWDYDKAEKIPIDHYEKNKGRSRSSCEMVMPRFVREELLRNYGHSRRDIDQAMKEIKKTKKKRMETVQNMKYDPIFYAAERTSRQLKKVFSFQKNNEKNKLKEQWEAADRLRAFQELSHEEERTNPIKGGEIVIYEDD